MKLTLQNDWLLVDMDPMPETVGSIIIPSSGQARDHRVGTVTSVGPGMFLDGVFQPMPVAVGDRVCFHRWNIEHKQGTALQQIVGELGDNVAIVRARDILLTWPADEDHEVA